MDARLADLNPSISQAPGCSIRLRFTCPACGPPYTIDVPISLNGLRGGPDIPTWTYTCPDPPNFSWDAVNVSPSINNTPSGHGRKKPCTWHGNIIDGEVRP